MVASLQHTLPRLREDFSRETEIHRREMEKLQAPIIEGMSNRGIRTILNVNCTVSIMWNISPAT